MQDLWAGNGDYADPWRKKNLKKKVKDSSSVRVGFNGPKEKICSHCKNNRAWYSKDHGKTWQCFEHK